jgi:hypothetical protein
MPIRTDRGRSAVTRQILGRVWWSPRHLTTTVLVSAAVITAGAVAGAQLHGHHPAAGAPAPRTSSPVPGVSATTNPATSMPSSAGASTSTAASSSSPLPASSTTLPSAGSTDAALAVGTAFVMHWVRPAPGVIAEQWLAAVTPYVMPESVVELRSVDPANIPATRVTGPAVTTATSPSVVQATVPTDAGAITVVVVQQPTGQWLVRTWDHA